MPLEPSRVQPVSPEPPDMMILEAPLPVGPIFRVVATPAKLTVVALVLTRAKEEEPVTRLAMFTKLPEESILWVPLFDPVFMPVVPFNVVPVMVPMPERPGEPEPVMLPVKVKAPILVADKMLALILPLMTMFP